MRRKLRPLPAPPTIAVSTPSTKEKNRPAKLTLSAKVIGQSTSHRASTTTQDYPPSLNVVAGSRRTTSPNIANGDKVAGNSKYKRVLSHDFHRGSRNSHPHSPHSLTLTYDRSRMKRPSVTMDTPISDNLHRDLPDSYTPLITVTPRSWPSKLARNYYSLNSCKFVLTFIINIILLSFKVRPHHTHTPYTHTTHHTPTHTHHTPTHTPYTHTQRTYIIIALCILI